jgi:hypothetical protein
MAIRVSCLVFALAGAVSACGTQAKKNTEKTPTTPAVEPAPADLPALLVAQVPVDADGHEQSDRAETRELPRAQAFADGAAVHTAFTAGNTVNVADELDSDTSSQQWRRRSYNWCWGNSYGYGRGYGSYGYGGGWSNRHVWVSWGSYGYGYNNAYGYANVGAYRYGGNNYYVYGRR